MSDDVVTTRDAGPLRWLIIDRPDTLNAIDFAVMERLEEELRRVHEDRYIRALILRGAGTRAFISGGDLGAFAALKTEADARRMARRMKAILNDFEALDCWVIACVNGPAFGGGCETCLAADFRVAATSATFGWTQTRFGVPCGWGGTTRLVEMVGRSRALHWLATRAIIPARAAYNAGLADAVFEDDALVEDTVTFAEELCAQPRQMIGALKRMARLSAEEPRSAAIRDEVEPFAALWASEEHHDRVDAFLARKDSKDKT